MNIEEIKKDLNLLLEKHSINIDELESILDDIFYEKYNLFYKSYSYSDGKNSSSVNTCSASSSLRGCQCSYNTDIKEDPDIKNNNPNCDY